MDRHELVKKVETGITILLMGTLVVMFIMNYNPNSKKIVDEYLRKKNTPSTSISMEINSTAESSSEENDFSDTSEKSNDTAESQDYIADSVPASNQSSKVEASVDDAPNVDEVPQVVVSAPQAGLININYADLNQLQQLDGIGKVKAQAIIDYREAHGAFRTVNELINVDGIGEKTLEKNLDRITV